MAGQGSISCARLPLTTAPAPPHCARAHTNFRARLEHAGAPAFEQNQISPSQDSSLLFSPFTLPAELPCCFASCTSYFNDRCAPRSPCLNFIRPLSSLRLPYRRLRHCAVLRFTRMNPQQSPGSFTCPHMVTFPGGCMRSPSAHVSSMEPAFPLARYATVLKSPAMMSARSPQRLFLSSPNRFRAAPRLFASVAPK